MPHTVHNYSQIKNDVRLWCARNDADFVAALPEFVHMAEQRIFYGAKGTSPSDPVRVRDMETRVPDLAITNGETDLPTDYLEIISIAYDSDLAKKLTYHPPNTFDALIAEGNYAHIYTIEGSKIRFLPSVTGQANLLYYKRYPELVNDTDSNWIINNAPGVYLKATLMQAFAFMRNNEQRQVAYDDYLSAADGLSFHTRRSTEGAVMAPRVPGTDRSQRPYTGV